ncbi:MAG: MmcQ/YjbR family DNA-binding protein [Myxococcota bacterium]
MKWETVVKLGRELPEVEEGFSYGTPALEVRGTKLIARLKEDGETLVFRLEDVDLQEILIETQPELYFITDHYRGWPAVLARLTRLRAPECRERLEAAWREQAPRTLVRRYDEARAAPKGRARAGQR